MNLVKYDAACQAIAEAFTLDEAKEITDKAVALTAYAKQMNNKESQIQWTEVSIRAERRWGQIYAESEKAKGGGTGANQHRAAGSETEPAATPTLEDMKVSKKASSRGTVSTMTQTSTDARGTPYSAATCHVAAVAKAVELRAIASKKVRAINVFCIKGSR